MCYLRLLHIQVNALHDINLDIELTIRVTPEDFQASNQTHNKVANVASTQLESMYMNEKIQDAEFRRL